VALGDDMGDGLLWGVRNPTDNPRCNAPNHATLPNLEQRTWKNSVL